MVSRHGHPFGIHLQRLGHPLLQSGQFAAAACQKERGRGIAVDVQHLPGNLRSQGVHGRGEDGGNLLDSLSLGKAQYVGKFQTAAFGQSRFDPLGSFKIHQIRPHQCFGRHPVHRPGPADG